MKVVLLDNVRGIGQIGDIKSVSDGYARNHLFPRGLARAASEGALKQVESSKAKKLESAALARTQAQGIASILQGARIELHSSTNPKGTFFSAIAPEAVADAISIKAGAHVKPDQLDMPGHIKTTGEYPVRVRLTDDVSADVMVIAQPTLR